MVQVQGVRVWGVVVGRMVSSLKSYWGWVHLLYILLRLVVCGRGLWVLMGAESQISLGTSVLSLFLGKQILDL